MIHYNAGDLLIHKKSKIVYIIYSITYNQFGITNLDVFKDGDSKKSHFLIHPKRIDQYEYVELPDNEIELVEVFKKYKVRGCKDLGLNIYDGIRNG